MLVVEPPCVVERVDVLELRREEGPDRLVQLVSVEGDGDGGRAGDGEGGGGKGGGGEGEGGGGDGVGAEGGGGVGEGGLGGG